MLKYRETNWKDESGFSIHKYDLAIGTMCPSKVSREQQKKIEKISLVAFLNEDQRKIFFKISRRLKQNNEDFYRNKNLHATLFGFGPLSKKDYQAIIRQIQLFTKTQNAALKINFDSIRPGSMYHGTTLKAIKGLSNGTVIALGDVSRNIEFFKYGNSLTKYLLKNKSIKSILGKNFRRKFPTVWITLGYYNRKDKFKIDTALEDIFKQYRKLDKDYFSLPISEISLVKSKYKNLRYPKLIKKFRL